MKRHYLTEGEMLKIARHLNRNKTAQELAKDIGCTDGAIYMAAQNMRKDGVDIPVTMKHKRGYKKLIAKWKKKYPGLFGKKSNPGKLGGNNASSNQSETKRKRGRSVGSKNRAHTGVGDIDAAHPTNAPAHLS